MLDQELWLEHEGEARGTAAQVHPTAIVHRQAELGQRVQVGAYSIIGPKVICADDVQIGSYVHLSGRTFVGQSTSIWHYCSIGAIPQDLKYRGEDTRLVIGERNAIREYVNISIGTEGGGGITRIGDGNLLMVHVHVAHDCIIGNNCIFANSVNLAGHVEIDNHVVLGGMAAVHQFCRLGSHSMMTGGSMTGKDVPPFCRVHGTPARILGLNTIGLKRAGMSAEDLASIKKIYRFVYRQQLTLDDAMQAIHQQVPDSPPRQTFLDFISHSQRGISR